MGKTNISGDKATFWRPHAAERRRLGLSREAYCRERGLSAWAMGYWEKKLVP